MRITVPEEIIRLTVPTWTPSVGDCLTLGAWRGRFTHLCVGSTSCRMSGGLALGAPPTDCLGLGCGCRQCCRVLTHEFSFVGAELQLRACHTTRAPFHMSPPVLWMLGAFSLLSEVSHRSPLNEVTSFCLALLD